MANWTCQLRNGTRVAGVGLILALALVGCGSAAGSGISGGAVGPAGHMAPVDGSAEQTALEIYRGEHVAPIAGSPEAAAAELGR
jgi:hypothetical protein